MVNTAPHSHDSETTRELNISLRGRTYPLTCRRTLSSPNAPPEPDSPTSSLSKRILSMLSFPTRHPDAFRGSSEIVRAFCSDMVLLETMATQWRRFLKQVRKANLTAVAGKNVSKRQQQQALDQALQVMGHESAVMVDDRGVLNGDLVEQPPVHVYQTLQETIRTVVSSFVEAMQQDLDQLSDLRVVGLLEWFGDRTCRFHFYEHQLTSVVDGRSTERQQVPMSRHGKTRLGTEVIEELTGRHVHSVTRKTELLIEAKSCAADHPDLVLPRVARECLRQCPTWLRPELQVVEGEKIREDWMELIRVEHHWQERFCKQRIQPHFDPALTIFGHYVLMGWDERAHQGEIQNRVRRSSDQLWQPMSSAAIAPDHRLIAMVAGIAAALFGIFMLLSAGKLSGVMAVALLPLTCLPTTYRYLSGGGGMIPLAQLEVRPIYLTGSVILTVMAIGFLMAAWSLHKPIIATVALVPIGGAVTMIHKARRSGGAA